MIIKEYIYILILVKMILLKQYLNSYIDINNGKNDKKDETIPDENDEWREDFIQCHQKIE